MKAIILAVLALTLSTMAYGEQGSIDSKQANSPEWVYTALLRYFPQFNEISGGDSYELGMESLTCSFSNQRNGKNEPIVKKVCTGYGKNPETDKMESVILDDVQSTELILVLINSGISQVQGEQSEPGTTYIQVGQLNCSVVLPANTPEHEAEYSCTYAE